MRRHQIPIVLKHLETLKKTESLFVSPIVGENALAELTCDETRIAAAAATGSRTCCGGSGGSVADAPLLASHPAVALRTTATPPTEAPTEMPPSTTGGWVETLNALQEQGQLWRAVMLIDDRLKEDFRRVGPEAFTVSQLVSVGDAYARVHVYDRAIDIFRIAFQLAQANSDRALAAVAFATVMRTVGEYDKALALLDTVPVDSLPKSAVSVIERQTADLYECAGDYVAALRHMEQSRKLLDVERASPTEVFDAVRMHIDLLDKVAQRTMPRPPADVITSLVRERDRLTERLLAIGPWMSVAQLPRTYIAGLRALPWHCTELSRPSECMFPSLAPLERLLEDSHAQLKAEAQRLWTENLLEEETECLHGNHRSSSESGSGDGGRWFTLSINGNWHRQRNSDGCSDTLTPAACRVWARALALVRPLGATRLLRATYSIIEHTTHIEPHYGMTNGQLKMHLGLTVPSSDCTSLTVHNESRAWSEGSVLFFDDSFRHSVWNNCTSMRAVFQLVFVHPDVEEGMRGKARADGGHSH